MTTTECIAARRSIRSFQKKEIPTEIVKEIILAGIKAPSGKNEQPWKIYIFQNDKKEELIKLIYDEIEGESSVFKAIPNGKQVQRYAEYSYKVMAEAPIVMLVENTKNKIGINQGIAERLSELVNVQSVSAAIENMLLVAAEKGLGSLWICDVFYAYEAICKEYGIHGELLCGLAFGYPNEEPVARPRKSIEEIAIWL